MAKPARWAGMTCEYCFYIFFGYIYFIKNVFILETYFKPFCFCNHILSAKE